MVQMPRRLKMKAHLISLMVDMQGFPVAGKPMLQVLKEQYGITERDKQQAFKVLFEMQMQEEKADPDFNHRAEWPRRKAYPNALDRLYLSIKTGVEVKKDG